METLEILSFAYILNVLLAVIGVFTPMSSGSRDMAAKFVSSSTDIENRLLPFVSSDDTLVLLLDFDGTLSKLAKTPDDAFIEPSSKSALVDLSTLSNVYLAIISGREVSSAYDKVRLDNITYAGNHGFEIKFADGEEFSYQLDDEMHQRFEHLTNTLKQELENNGAYLENKRLSLTLHLRNVRDRNDHKRKHDRAFEIIKSYGFKANEGKEAVEGKPPVDWNKGKAAKYILKKKFGNNWRQEVKVIYIGDDTTDEDAMKALKGRGAISFRVSESEVVTNADYRIPSTDSVSSILNWLYSRMSQ